MKIVGVAAVFVARDGDGGDGDGGSGCSGRSGPTGTPRHAQQELLARTSGTETSLPSFRRNLLLARIIAIDQVAPSSGHLGGALRIPPY